RVWNAFFLAVCLFIFLLLFALRGYSKSHQMVSLTSLRWLVLIYGLIEHLLYAGSSTNNNMINAPLLVPRGLNTSPHNMPVSRSSTATGIYPVSGGGG